MMSKIHIRTVGEAEKFEARLKKVFDEHNGSLGSGTPLVSRAELRYLERHGFVEKVRVFSARKYSNVTPTVTYIWKWRGVIL